MRIDRHCGVWLAAAALLPSAAATAQLDLQPFVAAAVLRDSNVFDFASRDEAIAANGSAERADTIQRMVAGLSLDYALGEQRLGADFEGRHFIYERFEQLDRNEYLWNLNLGLRSGTLGGRLDARQERRLASFADRETTTLTLERERRLGGVLFYNPGAWLYEAGARSRHLLTPLPLFPRFALDERTISARVGYKNTERTTVGVVAEWLDGAFEGTTSDDAYEQASLELAVEYAVSGLSRVEARLGYSQRDESVSTREDVSAITGSLALQRWLSGVTAFRVEAFRGIGSYTAGPQALVETGMRVGIDWRPAAFVVALGGEYRHNEFQAAAGLPDRTDREQAAYLRVAYSLTPWLQIQPYGQYRYRDSDVADESYRGTIVGLELRAQFGDRVPLRPEP